MSKQPISMTAINADLWVTHSVLAEIIKSTGAKVDWSAVEERVKTRLTETGHGDTIDHAKMSIKNIRDWSKS